MKKSIITKIIAIFIVVMISFMIISTSTAIGTNDEFKFVAWGDSRDDSSGINTNVFSPLATKVESLNPAFTIFVGDLCGSFSTSCITTWQSKLGNNLKSKTFAERGNHDSGTLSSWQSLWDFSTMANSVGATNYIAQTSDATYSFDYGNSHFVVIDLPDGGVGDLSSTQISWLNTDLNNAQNRMGSNLKHEFLFWHGPIYTVDGHIESPSSSLIKVLNDHPLISAGFFGHEHVTIHATVNNNRVPGITSNFEEIIVGRSGAPSKSISKPVDYSTDTNAFVLVTVKDNDFTVSFYSSSALLYSKTFTEGSGPIPTPTPTITPSNIPTCGFAATTISTKTIEFKDTSTNNPTRHDWIYGDGKSLIYTTSGTVTHQYENNGTYVAKHLSSNSYGVSNECSKIITIGSDISPVVDFLTSIINYLIEILSSIFRM